MGNTMPPSEKAQSTGDPMLTQMQITNFEVFGFAILRNFLTPEEIAIAGEEFNIGFARARATTQQRGIRKQFNWSNLGPESPFLGTLLEDRRFLASAEQLFAGEAIGHYANGNIFSGDRTEWHPDTAQLARRSIKFAFYLQPLDETSGALRFIPGSHKAPLHSDIRKVRLKETNEGVIDEDGESVDEMPAFIARSRPGDVIAFDSRVWHASWGGGNGRKMCSVGYFAAPTTAEEEDIVRQIARDEASLVKAFPLVRRPDHWIANVGKSPVRKKWIDYLKAHAFTGF